jgi:Ca-activated chloride channel family protein
MKTMLSRLILIVALAVPAAAQQQPVFRSTSDVVPLFVTAQDKSGRLITKLTRDDFQVLDNGKPQPLTVFDNSPQPIRLIILIDVSGSMAQSLPLLGAACAEMVGQLAPGDLARIGYFGTEIAISPKFTRDARELAGWLPKTVERNQPTPLWAAVDKAILEFNAAGIDGRRVIMVLSDSKDSGPQKMGQPFLSPLEIIDRANREDVMVYGVGVRSALPMATGDLRGALASTLPDPSLGRVADDTGGGYFELMPRDNLQTTFGRVADELHQQYLLGFAPQVRDGKTHKLEVKVKQDGAKVRVRKSYKAPKAG